MLPGQICQYQQAASYNAEFSSYKVDSPQKKSLQIMNHDEPWINTIDSNKFKFYDYSESYNIVLVISLNPNNCVILHLDFPW